MIKPFVFGRVYVFVDAANILYSQQTLRWRVNYEKLKKYFESECDLKGIYFYTGKVGKNDKQDKFIKRLERLGYSVRTKEVKLIKVGNDAVQLKGNLDIELSLDAFRLKDNYDTILLLSGDSDFAYLIDLLKEEGKRTIVLSTRGHISKELIERAKYIDLRKLRDVIKFKEPRSGPLRYDS